MGERAPVEDQCRRLFASGERSNTYISWRGTGEKVGNKLTRNNGPKWILGVNLRAMRRKCVMLNFFLKSTQ